MTKKRKKNPPKKDERLAVIENNVLHIKEFVDKLYDQMGSIEKNLNQVGLNKQSINTLKNNIKNINDVRIPNIKGNLKTEVDDISEILKSKVDKGAFYIMITLLAILNGIAIYFKSIFG